MIKISGADIAKITTDLHLMALVDRNKFSYQEFNTITMAIELLSLMYFHDHSAIEKDAE